MRVFLDTNVLVSAFATRGLCTDLFRLVLSEHEFFTAEVVLQELERVLLQRFGVPKVTVVAILDFLNNYEVVPKPANFPNLVVRDPDDVLVLASAIAGKADVLITGDQDLLSLRDQAGLRIVDPRGFWDLIKN